MDPFVPLMALCYLILQVSALFWSTPSWRKVGRFPIWAFAAAIVVLVVGNAMGSPLASILLLVSLPLMTLYLASVWLLYLILGQHRSASP